MNMKTIPQEVYVMMLPVTESQSFNPSVFNIWYSQKHGHNTSCGIPQHVYLMGVSPIQIGGWYHVPGTVCELRQCISEEDAKDLNAENNYGPLLVVVASNDESKDLPRINLPTLKYVLNGGRTFKAALNGHNKYSLIK